MPSDLEGTLDRTLDRLARRAGFADVDHRLDLIGTCAECARRALSSVRREVGPVRLRDRFDGARVDQDLVPERIDAADHPHPVVGSEAPRRDVDHADLRAGRIGDATRDDVAGQQDLVGGRAFLAPDESLQRDLFTRARTQRRHAAPSTIGRPRRR